MMETEELLRQWRALMDVFEKMYGEKPTLEALLFLIGVQELGGKQTEFSKDEKQDLIHIGICRMLSYWNYYERDGQDKDGWPVWKPVNDIPYMNLSQQSRLLRQGMLRYFRENEFEF